jgi:hypothetical protein
MNKLGPALLVAVLATLTLTGVAAAAAPQGHLSAALGGVYVTTSINITNINFVTEAADGETQNVALKNDTSGDCDGDSGSVFVTHTNPIPNTIAPVLCAHFTGNARMAFMYQDPNLSSAFVVVFVVDAATDRVYVGSTTDGALAVRWVNLGWKGSGAWALLIPFPLVPVTGGDFIVTA